MNKVLAILAVFLVLGFAVGAGARAESGQASQSVEASKVSTIQYVSAAPEEVVQSGELDQNGCCWDDLCFNASHCHHCGVSAFMAFGTVYVLHYGRDAFSIVPERLPRLSVHYAIIDPPRA